MKERKDGTERKVVDFNPEHYPEVLSALRKLKENLVESDLDRKSGKLIVVVTKGTSLDSFQEFGVSGSTLLEVDPDFGTSGLIGARAASS